jgi:DNA-binding NarL/FixJ family response regulator
MNTKKVLIVSDLGNQNYWNALTNEIKEKIGAVNIVLDKDLSWRRGNHPYDVIMMDISNLEDLHRLIPEIHHEQPRSRIIILSSTPTWKFTREVIRLGAATLIRKNSNLDEIISELGTL